MKKLTLLVGLGAGFVAGSWAGRGPYERVEAMVRNVMKQPKVQTTVHTAADGSGDCSRRRDGRRHRDDRRGLEGRHRCDR